MSHFRLMIEYADQLIADNADRMMHEMHKKFPLTIATELAIALWEANAISIEQRNVVIMDGFDFDSKERQL